MSYFGLLLINLRRNLIRTLLTGGAVTAALFLQCALAGILDTLADSIEVGSESRLITRNAISIIFDLPTRDADLIRQVRGVAEVSTSNWFGAQDPKDERGFFAQFAVDAATYFPMYATDLEITSADASPPGFSAPSGVDPKLGAFFADRTGAVIGETLAEKKGWKVGDRVTLKGTIYPGDHEFTIRALYKARNKSFGEEVLIFHWKYLYELSGEAARVGTFILALSDPGRAADISRAVDVLFENSSDRTKTETERAFQAGFVSMYGNLPFLLKVIGLAVVFAILLVAANAMMMTFRERTREIGVMKTLGFTDGAVFGLVLAEAAVLTVGGGLLGSLGAKAMLEWTEFNMGGFLPPMSVHWSTVGQGLAIALVVGAISGAIPAVLALRLRIVDALKRS